MPAAGAASSVESSKTTMERETPAVTGLAVSVRPILHVRSAQCMPFSRFIGHEVRQQQLLFHGKAAMIENAMKQTRRAPMTLRTVSDCSS